MEAELRVAYLTSAYGRTADTFIRNEVNELRRLGVAVDTYSVRRPPVDTNTDEEVIRHQKATIYLLEAGVGLFWGASWMALQQPARFCRALWCAWRTAAPGVWGMFLQCAYVVEAGYLARQLMKRRTDVLHDHIGENSASVAMLASEMSGIPFSMTIHGPSIFYAPKRWALSEKLSRAAFTACISFFCRSQCLLFAPPAVWPKLQIVRCSVQSQFSDNPPQRIPQQEARFICVGRLCAEKAQRLLIEAVRQLKGNVPSLRLALVGDGPDRADLERMIDESNLRDHVAILGWKSSGEIRELLANSTALVISSCAEGLPVVAMEALAIRCPVISTNIAAAPELIEPGVNGWLIPAGSVDHLVGAMKAAANCDADTLMRMGEAGRARVLELHHPARQAEQLKALFESATV